MTKRDALLNYLHGKSDFPGVPAAFFMHFESEFHTGRKAVEKHLEFCEQTGMDFVKIQYEQKPPRFEVAKAGDWWGLPRVGKDFFEPTREVVSGLVAAAKDEALVIMTLYSPLMWANDVVLVDGRDITAGEMEAHYREDPQAVQAGLRTMTDNVISLAQVCREAGIDGFYASSQGGERGRFGQKGLFEDLIRPCDLRVWESLQGCALNILHICDYELPYDDLAAFRDYPCDVVNCSLEVGGRMWSPREMSGWFGKPFMGGLERKGALSSGGLDEVRAEARAAIAGAEKPFILGADCTLLKGAAWENARAAVEEAHAWRG